MLALAGAATADPDAAAIWRKNLDERRHAIAMFAAELATTGQIRADQVPAAGGSEDFSEGSRGLSEQSTAETVVEVLWLAMDVRLRLARKPARLDIRAVSALVRRHRRSRDPHATVSTPGGRPVSRHS
jgi:hypothetical protein